MIKAIIKELNKKENAVYAEAALFASLMFAVIMIGNIYHLAT